MSRSRTISEHSSHKDNSPVTQNIYYWLLNSFTWWMVLEIDQLHWFFGCTKWNQKITHYWIDWLKRCAVNKSNTNNELISMNNSCNDNHSSQNYTNYTELIGWNVVLSTKATQIMSWLVWNTLAMIITLLKIIQPTHWIDWLKCCAVNKSNTNNELISMNNSCNDNHSSQNYTTNKLPQRWYLIFSSHISLYILNLSLGLA